MNPQLKLKYEFVEFIPDDLAEKTIYISLTYSTAVHKCVCGCRNKVVTPLSPTDWKLIFNGVSISLYPSIGNWSFECKSHYWIRNNRIIWAPKWSQEEIDEGRAYDQTAKEKYFDLTKNSTDEKDEDDFRHELKMWW